MGSAKHVKRGTKKLSAVPYPCTIWVREDSIGSTKELLFLQVEAPLTIDTTTELPMSFEFEGAEFSRYLGFYYLPTQKTEAEFAAFWDFLGAKYDQMTDDRLHEQLYAVFAKEIEGIPLSTLRVLDYGVGTGTYTRTIIPHLKEKNVELYGVDISEEMARIANSKGINARKISDNILPYPDDFFEVIISCFTTHLFADFRPFEEWFRVLRGSGRIVFNHRYPAPGFQEVYNKNLESIGFEEVDNKLHHIPATNKEWDVWITRAIKP